MMFVFDVVESVEKKVSTSSSCSGHKGVLSAGERRGM